MLDGMLGALANNKLVEQVSDQLESILTAYANGFPSTYAMGARMLKYSLPVMIVMIGVLLIVQRRQPPTPPEKERSWKEDVLSSAAGGAALGIALVGFPLTIYYGLNAEKVLTGSSTIKLRLAIVAVCTAIGALVGCLGKSVAVKATIGTFVSGLLFVVGGTRVIRFFSNAKDREMFGVFQDLVSTKGCNSTAKSAVAGCAHPRAALLSVMDKSLPDFVERGVEALGGWEKLAQLMKAHKFAEQLSDLGIGGH
jgi:hypothetical protein